MLINSKTVVLEGWHGWYNKNTGKLLTYKKTDIPYLIKDKTYGDDILIPVSVSLFFSIDEV